MSTLILAFAAALMADEAELRETFSRDIQAKEASARAAAVKKLSGAREHQTVELLAASLKDADLEVRKATAETLAGVSDGGGAAIKPLGEIVVDKKEDLDLRLACAKALGAALYRSDSLPYLFKVIWEIESAERQFHKFGAQVTAIIDKVTGKSFGAVKETPERWQEWWSDHKDELVQEDAKKKEEWKKAQR
ncbi:MAG TPA: HEAT repeat domain-containing protein [Planctomycetota bacterium]|nr:HEAT repeat domain-containing protein [Planctomycetota bacterium]